MRTVSYFYKSKCLMSCRLRETSNVKVGSIVNVDGTAYIVIAREVLNDHINLYLDRK